MHYRLADGFAVLDDSLAEMPESATSFAVSEALFEAAHRVAWDLRSTTELSWVLFVDQS